MSQRGQGYIPAGNPLNPAHLEPWELERWVGGTCSSRNALVSPARLKTQQLRRAPCTYLCANTTSLFGHPERGSRDC